MKYIKALSNLKDFCKMFKKKIFESFYSLQNAVAILDKKIKKGI